MKIKRLKAQYNAALDLLMPGFIALMLLLFVAFVAMEIDTALNPPTHEGEHVITWDGYPIWVPNS